MSEALRPAIGNWLQKIRLAWEFKKKEFSDDGDECMRFFDGPYTWLYSPSRGSSASMTGLGGDDELPGPSARMTVNKTAELVQLFGPALYHRNPVRKVSPRHVVGPPLELYQSQQDPSLEQVFAMQQQEAQRQWAIDNARSDLLQRYLNYTPSALDLKTESRWAITEALIKGMGCLWTGPHRAPGAVMTWAGSFFDSVDNLLLDPDAETFRDIKWMARKRVRPNWEVEREKGLPEGSLKGHASGESFTAQAATANDPDGDYRRKTGRTADLVVYWEVWSKMGLGGRLSGIPTEQKQQLDQWGDWVYLEITENCPYPLNLPPPLCDAATQPDANPQLVEEVRNRLSWDTPLWADGEWPMTPIVFHWRPKRLWPMSHMKPGLGELQFLNWAWSFLASKVRRASRDFIVIAKSAAEDLKNNIKHGADYSVMELENIMGSIDNVVKFLQHPPFAKDIYEVIQGVTENFERRVGLTELIYGQSGRQMRSAQEAQLKSDAINVRPDDMANTVEDAMTDVARKEAFVARWHLKGEDVQQVLGPTGAELWDALLVASDPASVLYALEYRIEANSARKPNRALEQSNMHDAMQQLFQPLLGYAQTFGNVGPINALISDWATANDLDATKYLLPPPPPPPPPGEATGPPGGNAPPKAA